MHKLKSDPWLLLGRKLRWHAYNFCTFGTWEILQNAASSEACQSQSQPQHGLLKLDFYSGLLWTFESQATLQKAARMQGKILESYLHHGDVSGQVHEIGFMKQQPRRFLHRNSARHQRLKPAQQLTPATSFTRFQLLSLGQPGFQVPVKYLVNILHILTSTC